MKKDYKIITICLFLLVTFFAVKVLGGGIYLVKGVGLRGMLEIGQEKGNAQVERWITDEDSSLKYKVNDQRLIVLIKCDHNRCIADRNITVRTSKETLLRRYGLPDRENNLQEDELNGKGGTLYEYQGIGFGIDKDGIVQAIYIFPIFKKK